MTDISELYKRCQASAPSYLGVVEDGVPMRCSDCHKVGQEPMVKIFTPDHAHHLVVHKSCVDPEWISSAKFMGVI